MKPLIFTSSKNPQTPEPGVYEDVPWEEYTAWNCFSKSMVYHSFRSGEHLDYYIHGEKPKSDSMTFGSLVDCLVLEPDMFSERFALQPETYQTTKTTGRGAAKETKVIIKPWNLNSTTCRETKAELEATGKSIITKGDYERARSIRDELYLNGEAAVAITEGKKQVSMVWQDEETGILCKGRADIVGKKYIDDLKTTRDASPEGFSREIGKFLYHVQAAAYADAWEQLTGDELGFRFICAETSQATERPPVALYELDNVSIVTGRLALKRALRNVRRWLDNGITGYSPYWEPIEAPQWLVDREINMTNEEVEL